MCIRDRDRDGTKSGYDVDLLKEITNTTNIPVIASGGVGNLDHLYDGIVKGGASAVLAASINSPISSFTFATLKLLSLRSLFV